MATRGRAACDAPPKDMSIHVSSRGILLQKQSAEEYPGVAPAVVGMVAFASALPMTPTAIALAGAETVPPKLLERSAEWTPSGLRLCSGSKLTSRMAKPPFIR